jgi:hypothetical protein
MVDNSIERNRPIIERLYPKIRNKPPTVEQIIVRLRSAHFSTFTALRMTWILRRAEQPPCIHRLPRRPHHSITKVPLRHGCIF